MAEYEVLGQDLRSHRSELPSIPVKYCTGVFRSYPFKLQDDYQVQLSYVKNDVSVDLDSEEIEVEELERLVSLYTRDCGEMGHKIPTHHCDPVNWDWDRGFLPGLFTALALREAVGRNPVLIAVVLLRDVDYDCPAIMKVWKRPRLCLERTQSLLDPLIVGVCLISKDLGKGGRVIIPEAIAPAASNLYQDLGFVAIEERSGTGYEFLSMGPETANRLLESWR